MIMLQGTDIGEVAKKGSLVLAEGNYVLTASGSDIWGTKDQGFFSFLKHKGDFDFSVRITSLSMPHLYTKAGIMARETVEEDSPHIYWMVFGSNEPRNKNNGGCEFQYREQKGGDSVAIYPTNYDAPEPEFPVSYPNTWLRLQRWGDEFISYFSEDGKSWKEYDRHTMLLKEELMLGVCATSHEESEMVECVFTDVSL